MACLYSQRVEFLCVNSICVSHPTRLSPRFLRYMLRGFLLSGGVSICIGGGPKWSLLVWGGGVPSHASKKCVRNFCLVCTSALIDFIKHLAL